MADVDSNGSRLVVKGAVALQAMVVLRQQGCACSLLVNPDGDLVVVDLKPGCPVHETPVTTAP